MFIIEKRLDTFYAIEVEESDVSLQLDLFLWLSPFFSVQETIKSSIIIITKFILYDKCNNDMEYIDGVFWINSRLPKNMLCEKVLFLSRALFKTIALEFGYQNLHAGCIVHKSKGILITAERNQGKTTLLLNSMLDGSYSFLANDQVMYNSVNNQILGYPSVIGIRNNSVRNTKKWNEIKRLAVLYSKDPFQSQEKPLILPRDLCSLFHCSITEKCELSLIIRYEKSENSDDLIIKEVDDDRLSFAPYILPLDQTYSNEIYDSCFTLIENLVGTIRFPTDLNNKNTIKLIDVCCGMNRIHDMFEAIRIYLT